MKIKQSHKNIPRLGVFTALFNGDYHSELVSGIEAAARSREAQVLYFPGGSLNSPCPHERRHNLVYDIALNAALDGLIILSVVANYCREAELIEFVSRYKHIPLVTINFRVPFSNAILTNNKQGFTALITHLIETHGYRKLAFVKGPEYNPDAMERFDIYNSALSQAGIAFNPLLIVEGNYSYFSGLMAVKQLFGERGLKAGKDIEAIVCANDATAFGVIDSLHDFGFHVPDDIAVTGFDDISESVFPKFPLTSVQPHLYEIGSRAVNVLLDYQPDQEPLFFEGALTLRRSCGCPQPEAQTQPAPGEGVKKDSGGHKKDPDFVFYQYIAIINNLILMQKKADLTAWMQNNLPALGIKSAWLFIDSQVFPANRVYTLLTGYDREIPENTPYTDFIAEKLIFNDFLFKRKGRSFSVFPLLFKDEKYGLLVIEVHKLAFLNYNTLCNLIGNSIKNILLGEELADKNGQLIQSNHLLKEANEQKTQFFINVAHETKTPLTLIQNYLACYMEEQAPDERLLIIKQNIDQLLANMLNFLDVEKLQKSNMVYQHNDLVDLGESARRKCALFQGLAGTKDMRITLNTGKNILIRIDPWALDRIFNNLLDNAVKYTQDGGWIKVDVESCDGMAILRIRDNGPGLPADTYEHMFEPYYLLSKRKTSKQGIGVGLSIVKKIVDGLGACIAVEKHKGGGTCFTITFADSSAEQAHEKIQEIPATVPTPLMPGNIRERNIAPDKSALLIVDDNVQLLSFLQTAFEDSYNVYLAQDTAEALLKLKKIPHPALIISDIMMDGPDGFQLLTILSAMEGFNDIPLIFLTAMGSEKEKIRGLNLGAVDYIEKPFSIKTLTAKVESLITLRKRQTMHHITHIRRGIDKLFSASEESAVIFAKQTFDFLYQKYGLNSREEDIIRLLLTGLVHKEIASRLNLSPRAVEYHITKIYKKCGVTNKYDLLNKFQG